MIGSTAYTISAPPNALPFPAAFADCGDVFAIGRPSIAREQNIDVALRIRCSILLEEMEAVCRLGSALADPVISDALLAEFNDLRRAHYGLSKALGDLESRTRGGRA
jgi:hypothetical protein